MTRKTLKVALLQETDRGSRDANLDAIEAGLREASRSHLHWKAAGGRTAWAPHPAQLLRAGAAFWRRSSASTSAGFHIFKSLV
ncbi:hypothetical protein RLIN73S_05937 [Rhodanobacter lindaniclasticus]